VNDDQKRPPSRRAPVPHLRWDDPEHLGAWLKVLREQIDNGLAAGEDATRRYRKRVLSRPEARRKLRAAGTMIDDLLAMADRTFDTK
jgi:hypothetical protein